MEPSALTAKQARFISEYLIDGNGAAAAVRAGYGVAGAKVTASRLLTNPNVSDMLQARQASDADRLSIQREDVLNGLLESIQMAKEQGNPNAMISGWREIGKMLGHYEPKTVNIDIAVRPTTDERRLQYKYEAMSDAELQAIIDGKRTVDLST